MPRKKKNEWATFDEWFRDQFGPQPGANKATVEQARWALRAAEKELRDREQWEEHWRAARYAYNVKDSIGRKS